MQSLQKPYGRSASTSMGARAQGSPRLFKRFMGLVLGLGLAVALTGNGWAKPGATPVTCGDTITVPGEYYLVDHCSGPTITVRASNVNLNLAAHGIVKDDGDFSPAIVLDNVSNVRVHHGSIYFADDGVIVQGGTNCQIDHLYMDVTYGPDSGIIVYGSNCRIDSNTIESRAIRPYYSIYTSGDKNVVSNNVMNLSMHGIRCVGKYTKILGNSLEACFNGIEDDTGIGGEISRNTIGDPVNCLWVLGGVGNRIQENTVLYSRHPVYISGRSNLITHNVVMGGENGGIDLSNLTNSWVGANTVSFNEGGGIFCGPGSTGNTFKENIAFDNYYSFDLMDFNPYPPLPNTWQNNAFGTSYPVGLIH